MDEFLFKIERPKLFCDFSGLFAGRTFFRVTGLGLGFRVSGSRFRIPRRVSKVPPGGGGYLTC